jgi:hypothetical protein
MVQRPAHPVQRVDLIDVHLCEAGLGDVWGTGRRLAAPVGLGIAAVNTYIGILGTRSAEQKAKADTLSTALAALNDEFKDLKAEGETAGDAADQAFRKAVGSNPDRQRVVVTLNRMGVSFDELMRAATSGDPSVPVKRLNDEIERQTELANRWEGSERVYAAADAKILSAIGEFVAWVDGRGYGHVSSALNVNLREGRCPVLISRRRPLMAALLVIMMSALTLTAAGTAHAGLGLAAAKPLPPLPMRFPGDIAYSIKAGVTQRTVADGAAANVTIGKPRVWSVDTHSLASLAVRSADGRNNVQIGWTVDQLLNPDDEPRLFVIHRANGIDSCYNYSDNDHDNLNDCGFEPYGASSIQPGDALSPGQVKRFTIQHSGDRWWVGYGTGWIGSFPDSLWSGGFTQASVMQYFGEVSTVGHRPCADMGTGSVSGVEAARFGSISVINGRQALLEADVEDANYDVEMISDRTFRYGGLSTC